MKKILKLVTSILVVLSFIACNNDDDTISNQVNLIGKWQLNQVGGEINGEEVLLDYIHKCPDQKDFLEVFHNNTLMLTISDENCEKTFINNTWELEGNIIKIDSGEETEILILNSLVLKTRGINENGDVIILVFQRI